MQACAWWCQFTVKAALHKKCVIARFLCLRVTNAKYALNASTRVRKRVFCNKTVITTLLYTTLLCRQVSSYNYSTHLHVHDITNVLPNAPSPRLAPAEETSALRRAEGFSRRTLGLIHNTRSNTTNYSNLNYVLRQTGSPAVADRLSL